MTITVQEQLLDQKPIIDHYLSKSKNNLSAFSFINIFAWKDFFQFGLKKINESLCVFAQSPVGYFLYLPPLAENDSPETINECFHLLEELNQGSGVTRIENVDARRLRHFPPEQYSYFEKGYEYCYYKENIAGMRGNRYSSKRSSYNQFVKNNNFRYTPYESNMIDECLELYLHWALNRREACSEDIYCQLLLENEKVHEVVLRHWQKLGLAGRVVMIDNKIKAYSFGYALNEDMFCILFEIVALDIKGLPVYIFTEFCRDEDLKNYKFINVMDDFGMDNIRQTKLSFHPDALLQSYVVTKKRLKVF